MEKTTQKSLVISILGIIQIIIIIASIVLSIYFYQHFPAVVPMHWNVAGEVDGWSGRGLGAFLLPALLVAIYFLFELLPKIDPRRERYVEFAKVYSIIKTAIMLVLFGVYIIASLNSLGLDVSVGFWIPLIIGLLFIVLGSYFKDIKSNYFVGIRTPWTLANEVVWDKTHRLGGKLFVIGGVIMAFMDFAPVAMRIPLFIIVLIIIAVVPIVYSYILFKHLQK